MCPLNMKETWLYWKGLDLGRNLGVRNGSQLLPELHGTVLGDRGVPAQQDPHRLLHPGILVSD